MHDDKKTNDRLFLEFITGASVLALITAVALGLVIMMVAMR